MDQSNLDKLRHSSAHLLAAAVLNLWPETKLTIGPAIEDGFYYDLDFKDSITEEDLPKIEKEMAKILPSWTEFKGREISKEEAKKIFKDNPYKLELIDEIVKKGEKITLYKSGNFEDLCRGGHVENPSKEIGAFKLLSVAGAYWRGDEKNKMLTRIYGTSFPTQKELDDYLNQLEEAKKRDHKKLGPELGLFMFHHTSPGMPYWLPKGTVMYNELVKFWREEHLKRGYQETMSPILNKKELYITSGHFDHYWDDMFTMKTYEGEEYGVKAMNCPNAMVIFGMRKRSYRELPMRLSDTDPLHRYERSGTLNGLLRVREFRQDDAHIFVEEGKIKEEIERIFEITDLFYSIFNLEYYFRLGTRPEKFMGDSKVWDKAESELKQILEDSGREYTVEEGEGAFYGPKIDIMMKDSIGRKWQMGTIQLDFQQPLNFKLEYVNEKGEIKTPVAIHRVIYGSLERFIGIMIEHFAGKLPLWLSPVQVTIVPVRQENISSALEIAEQFKNESIRAEVDDSTDTLGAKIRNATLQRVPYLGIIGDKEIEKNTISVRDRSGNDLGSMEISDFSKKVKEEIAKKV